MNKPRITATLYKSLYEESVRDPESFWRKMAQRISWIKFPTIIKNTSFTEDILIKWYEDGILNVCVNCVDRHLPERADQPALIFEGDEPDTSRIITYKMLKSEVCRLANCLRQQGVKKGDRVTIYMPMIPEAVYAILACARIGAIHSVVFGGFSPEALKDRILDCQSRFVITADQGRRGGKTVSLKQNVDQALLDCPDVQNVLIFKNTGANINFYKGRDLDWAEHVNNQSIDCPPEAMNAEDPLFILYTSGSTGKPKGVLHTSGGYLVYVSLTHQWSFDYQEGDIYWCTADIGWVTGHSYCVYGPLANGATSLIFEGVPSYPDFSRFWQIIDKHKVNIFYTAPTAIRSLLREGDDFVTSTSRKSLRILATVGEPINSEAWHWYNNVVGHQRCPIIDTWWQTETGGHMITPFPYATNLKAGSATKPFFGIVPALVDGEGHILEGVAEGNLCILESWPGQMRTVYGDHARFKQTYFSTFKGMYFTGDGARRDHDNDYWITGRVDDVINVSGHRLGTAEIESAINTHQSVAESAVVGYPHDLKGQGIFAYVLLKNDHKNHQDIKAEIINTVRKTIGPIATPDIIQIVIGLPKTRSGKIMRRILRKIAANEFDNLGDISTLADPTIVDQLIDDRQKNIKQDYS